MKEVINPENGGIGEGNVGLSRESAALRIPRRFPPCCRVDDLVLVFLRVEMVRLDVRPPAAEQSARRTRSNCTHFLGCFKGQVKGSVEGV